MNMNWQIKTKQRIYPFFFTLISRNPYFRKKQHLMKKLSLEELNRMNTEDFKKSPKRPLVIILDNVRSLNNIGSIFRTCDAFRIEKLILSGITATPPHRDIQKTALGATESVEWEYSQDTLQVVRPIAFPSL